MMWKKCSNLALRPITSRQLLTYVAFGCCGW